MAYSVSGFQISGLVKFRISQVQSFSWASSLNAKKQSQQFWDVREACDNFKSFHDQKVYFDRFADSEKEFFEAYARVRANKWMEGQGRRMRSDQQHRSKPGKGKASRG